VRCVLWKATMFHNDVRGRQQNASACAYPQMFHRQNEEGRNAESVQRGNYHEAG